MKPPIKIVSLLLLCLLLFGRCKDKYVSPYPTPATGYLVVEGYIASNDITQFSLSRTIPLAGSGVIPAVTGARVFVEGDDNSSYPLPESGSGNYGTAILPLNTNAKYRLRIQTADGKNYQSDLVPFKTTPAIDSIGWTLNATGLDIYVNTHDPADATHYYQWLYKETWEYHSAEYSTSLYLRDSNEVVLRPDSAQIYACYQNSASSALILGSSAKLARDVIYQHPLDHIAVNTSPLGVLFSTEVRQYALTEEGYNFLTLMQKNTESLGSIFDAQPSVLKGNIHAQSNSAEQVIGYISAGTIQKKRIFIYRSELPSWSYYVSCPLKDTLVPPDDASLDHFFGPGNYTPIVEHLNNFGFKDGWTSNETSCVDCRLQGGTTTKPSFWPN